MIGQMVRDQLQQLAPELSLEEKSLESFDEIELTEEEKAEALRKGREEKHYKLRREQYGEGLRKPAEFRLYTAEEYYMAFCRYFPINEKKERDYANIVKRLCCYFAADNRFNHTGREWHLSKGILLFGGVGVG